MNKPDIKTLNRLARSIAYREVKRIGFNIRKDVIEDVYRANHYGLAIGDIRLVQERKHNYDSLLACEIVKARRIVRSMNWDLLK